MSDNFSQFDIIQFLEDHDIQYWTGGRNVRKNNINITCPFCGDHDYSGNNHLGIDLNTKQFNCWICNAGKGKIIIHLIEKLLNISYKKARNIIQKYDNQNLVFNENSKNEYKDIGAREKIDSRRDLTPTNRFNFISDIAKFPKIHIKYLEKRNFDPNKIIKEFKLKACYNIGDWKFRLIAPIFLDGNEVSFLTRDITDKAEIPYLPLPDDQSIIPYKEIIYNIDNCKTDSILIVEGITDCWRFGKNCGATMSYNFTNEQITLLVKKGFTKCFIIFDSEPKAQEKAKELQMKLSPFLYQVEILELTEGDPADMKQSEADALKKELKL